MASSDISIGLSGLLTSQRALQIIGHNIANVNTPGYSRQSLSISTNIPNISPFGLIGSGASIEQILRIKDDMLDPQINNFTSLLGSSEVQNSILKNLEAIFNELSGSSLNGMMEKFFQSIHELSANPELGSNRYQLLQDALNLVTYSFRSLDEQFGRLKDNVGRMIETKTGELNSITSQIASLNQRIMEIEIYSGSSANDLLDKRDNLLSRLSKLADIRIVKNNRNSSVDVVLGGTSVVYGYKFKEITASPGEGGSIEIYNLSTNNINQGELRGLLDMQNKTIPKYIQLLNTLAASFIKEVNNVHTTGIGLSGGFTSLTSTNMANNADDPLTDTGLPFHPSVTKYATGTVTSTSNGNGTTTVTGDGTLFSSNVRVNNFIKLSDGNFYKILSVDSNTQLTISGEYTDDVPASTDVTDGILYINVISPSGEITKTSMSIASEETLNTLAAKISGIANIHASVNNGFLTIVADSGYQFNFTRELDTNPGNIGDARVTVSGYHTGNDNDIFTLTVMDAGDGSIGTGNSKIRVTDSIGKVLADLDVGSSYSGGYLQITDGIYVSFEHGDIAAGDKLLFDVSGNPDTSNILTSLGLNTFFGGSDASTIRVTQFIIDDVTRIAAATTRSAGDNSNALRLISLQDSKLINGSTFSDFLHNIVAQLGTETAQKASEKESFQMLLMNLENRRQEISGVSIDEEMIHMLRFQQAFQASARYISVISEINDILMKL
ncbi:MAG: flagellar hook-associated protein FlgK [Candidatus Loosdrechtia sp.]|uniref:flagellar hook-associated protein FlgK n=1 Tax=Candidatus Loosdrechtia sp. TaxID=3101272 RepID=UPI003A5E0C6D|nr:MAG: flagellar hook-associated protein FlgK [Candidatus Jettenia sp. AMX2]